MESKRASQFIWDNFPQFYAGGVEKSLSDIHEAMHEFSDQQNATLIEQNRKLISDINLAIVMLESPLTSHKSVIERLQQTLTDTENGK